MMFRAFHGWILGLTAVAVFLAAVAYQGHFLETQNEAVAFVTIGLDQSHLSAESSSYEILRATEHFSDLVLGWTVEPSFKEDFFQLSGGFEFSARRQEKSNLLFTVTGTVSDVSPARELVTLLRSRLAEYDAATGAGFVVALERETMVTTTQSSWRLAAGFTMLVLLVEALMLCGFEYARRR